jgi:hypothetical protein
MSAVPGKRRNLWPWLPVVGLVVVIIPNVALFIVTRRVRPAMVEQHPYLASQHIDAEKARRAAFVAAGLTLDLAVRDPRHLVCRLIAPTPVAGIHDLRLHLYRPDDITGDRILDWPDATTPLEVELPKAGTWRVHVSLAAGTTEMESAVQPLDSSGAALR